MSPIELEITLAQVVGEDKFKKWWAVAKKAVAKDPRVAVPEKKTECYIVRETPVSAEDEILEQFNGTRSARRRMQSPGAVRRPSKPAGASRPFHIAHRTVRR